MSTAISASIRYAASDPAPASGEVCRWAWVNPNTGSTHCYTGVYLKPEDVFTTVRKTVLQTRTPRSNVKWWERTL